MRILFFITLLLLSACKGSNQTVKEIELYNISGDRVGSATFMEQPKSVNITLKVEGLTPGFHGIHIHEFPKCEPPNFQSAGNHLNPDGKKHGLMHPKGAHLGDLPNVEADNSGNVDIELELPNATLLDGKESILQNEGSSLIITEKEDDGMSQPAGDSGARIICGELTEKSATESKEPPSDPTENNQEEDN